MPISLVVACRGGLCARIFSITPCHKFLAKLAKMKLAILRQAQDDVTYAETCLKKRHHGELVACTERSVALSLSECRSKPYGQFLEVLFMAKAQETLLKYDQFIIRPLVHVAQGDPVRRPGDALYSDFIHGAFGIGII